MKPTAVSIAAIALIGGISAAQAATSPAAGTKLSQNECVSIWNKASGGKTGGLTEEQTRMYVADFKAANPDGDATIDEKEWMAACDKGLIKSAINMDAPAATAPASNGKTSDRTPGNPSPDRTPNATGAGAAGTDAGQTTGGTSDRTPAPSAQ